MANYLTVAEIYLMQHRLIEIFGGLHGVRDKGAVEAAVFRPQTGCYNSIEEEAAALMETAEHFDQSMLHPVDFSYRKVIRHLLDETLQQVTVASNRLSSLSSYPFSF